MIPMLVLAAGLGLIPRPASPAPGPVSFSASDGVTIYAQTYAAQDPGAPVILLFHQANSSKNEYAPIAPQLVTLGYNVIAIDQRSGGDLYPPTNETVQHLGRSAEFTAVLPDMDGALSYAKKTYPGSLVYVWGSSYSASLVFALAAKHPKDIAAVLAFSPGEYFDDKHYVQHAAKRVRQPVFIDTASDPKEEADGRAIYRELASRDKTDFVPKNGIHGSSTLRDDKDPGGAPENWAAVTAFLAHLAKH